MQNKRNGKEYEIVVAELGEKLFNLVKPKNDFIVNSGNSNKWMGISEYSHQIDVSMESPNLILLIECKNWDYNVNVPSFLTFLARVIDIRSKHKGKEVYGKVVTTKGYQAGVQLLASYYKIDLDKVKNYQEYLLKFKHYGIFGVADRAKGTDSVKVNRICSSCGSELVLIKDGVMYVCPYCPES